ncbi:MAG: GNAT family N-acetyltransferase [Anaerolineales bacterium]|jgi:predicted N-acetyltransferase YhbS
MRIDYLADHTDVMLELASIHCTFFGRFKPDMTPESRAQALGKRSGKTSIPLTLVALDQKIPIGSVSLVEHDLDSRPDLSPWVASVVVRSDYQRQGAGTALMRRIETEAVKLGIKKLYLFTPDMEVFYRTLNWVTIGQEIFKKRFEVTLMEKKILA